MHKLRNAEFMIHLDPRYAYNHFNCLMMVYEMILSLRKAFQGLTSNGSFVYLEYWNLEDINVLKTSTFFEVEKKMSIKVIVDNGALRLTP